MGAKTGLGPGSAFFRLGFSLLGLSLAGLGACSHVSEAGSEARMLATPSCSDYFFPIYFSGRSTGVSAEAQVLIRTAGLRAKGCGKVKVEVVGLPDPAAEGDGQPPLVRERARRLAEALSGAGLPPARFQVSVLGEAGAALPNAAVPKHRVNLFLRFER